MDQILLLFDVDQLLPLEGSVDVSTHFLYLSFTLSSIFEVPNNALLKSPHMGQFIDYISYLPHICTNWTLTISEALNYLSLTLLRSSYYRDLSSLLMSYLFPQ